ncbi:hypothetical protein BW722_06745 [Lawsonia intracellularis]|nr:hypothetical protein BW722_06745 [Lawsonia intracellularis]
MYKFIIFYIICIYETIAIYLLLGSFISYFNRVFLKKEVKILDTTKVKKYVRIGTFIFLYVIISSQVSLSHNARIGYEDKNSDRKSKLILHNKLQVNEFDELRSDIVVTMTPLNIYTSTQENKITTIEANLLRLEVIQRTQPVLLVNVESSLRDIYLLLDEAEGCNREVERCLKIWETASEHTKVLHRQTRERLSNAVIECQPGLPTNNEGKVVSVPEEIVASIENKVLHTANQQRTARKMEVAISRHKNKNIFLGNKQKLLRHRIEVLKACVEGNPDPPIPILTPQVLELPLLPDPPPSPPPLPQQTFQFPDFGDPLPEPLSPLGDDPPQNVLNQEPQPGPSSEIVSTLQPSPSVEDLSSSGVTLECQEELSSSDEEILDDECLTSGDESSTSDGESQRSSPPTKRRKLTHTPPPSERGSHPGSSSMLMPYYTYGQVSSLQGLQSTLMSLEDQLATQLRLSIIRSINVLGVCCKDDNQLQPHTFQSKKQTKIKGGIGRSHSTDNEIRPTSVNNSLSFSQQWHVIASMDSRISNLETTISSRQAGVFTTPIDGLCLSLLYSNNKKKTQNFYGVVLDSVDGSAKAQIETDNILATVTWNKEHQGFSGHLAGCYGWGKITNIRTIHFFDNESVSKGISSIHMNGGFIQLGYNILLGKNYFLIPYVEYMRLAVAWDPYEEHTGIIPCKVSGHKVHVCEKSIGLRNQWKITDNSQLQFWGSHIFTNHNTGEIASKPLSLSDYRNKISIPGYKKQYIHREAGISYESNVMDTLSMERYSKLRVTKSIKDVTSYTSFTIRYVY